MKVNIGYLVSYDYHYLLTSVKLLYEHVEKIHVAIDKDRLTWSGNTFEIPESFFEEVKAFDTKNKIEFYFDQFYVKELTPMECETRERNLLMKKMGKGWHIQLDVDEYVYDFPVLLRYLKKYWYLNIFPKLTPVQFRGKMVTLYRELPDGYLYIENNERFTFVTNASHYTLTRHTFPMKSHFMSMTAIHQSWARPEAEIMTKIMNWGHRDDFDTMAYFDFWKNLDSSNYKDFENVHPTRPDVWNKLQYIKATSIDEFIDQYAKNHPQRLIPINPFYMVKTGFKKIFKKLF
ncbi:hypothetical protein [Flavobacterium sp.]|uniref:hypothetical protein n=1 Tax=Flavobacterium sp. TaxID=239 RepID=UPI0039E238DA